MRLLPRLMLVVKELAEINSKGTPPGIVLLNAAALDHWVFLISVLGDETIYAVCQPSPPPFDPV